MKLSLRRGLSLLLLLIVLALFAYLYISQNLSSPADADAAAEPAQTLTPLEPSSPPDPSAPFRAMLRERGVRFILSSDSHAADTLDCAFDRFAAAEDYVLPPWG